MTILTEKPPEFEQGKSAAEQSRNRRVRLVAVIATVVLVAGGLGAGLALAIGGSSSQPSVQGATSISTQFSPAPKLADPTATARTLVTKFFSLLEQNDVPGLRSFLSPAFQVERADGSGTTGKTAYLAKLPSVLSFRLTGMSGTQDGSVLVARYQVTTTGTINGKPYTPGPAPRLSVFVWSGSAWHLVAHANFNPLTG